MRRPARAIAPLLLIGTAVATASAQGAFAQRTEVSVLVGGLANVDACTSIASVTGLNPRGDNYLSVRAQPSRSGRELDRLGPGSQVWVCDEFPGGGWTGIVYAPQDSDVNCGVSSPVSPRVPYEGPCAAGWVASRYLRVAAG